MLIISGMGHSGTKFVAELFKTEHEGLLKNYGNFNRAWKDKTFAKEFVKTFDVETRDSNSFLVPFIWAIQQEYPHATIIHLVRDPKKVVPSIMATNGGTIEEVSKNWVLINSTLRKLKLPVLKLEDLNGLPVNQHINDSPKWDDWSDNQKNILLGICSKEMKHYGY